MKEEHQELFDKCLDVLHKNDKGNHTKPAGGLYPHQWLWDSCFIAIGLRHVDVERAKTEIETLFKAQWANGMVPHIIFEPDRAYRAERNIWKSWSSPFSPDNRSTSGISQPPMLAEAIWMVGEKLSKTERTQWFKKLLGDLIRHHEWLYNERDPHSEGLVLQIHPYETGLDSTPPWQVQLHEHTKPKWIEMIEWLKIDGLVNMLRRDTRYVPPGQRMTNIDALLYWDIIGRFRRKGWDISKILHRSEFCIEDVTFNSILVRANKRLNQIAKVCRMKIPEHLTDAMRKTEKALETLWDEQSEQFYSRDFITHKLILEPSIGGLLPIYAGTISKVHIAKLHDLLRDHRQYWTNHPVPSVPLTSKFFSDIRYWQGPSWVNTNWLLIDGLRRCGLGERAEELKQRTIETVEKSGVFEYFSPVDGRGLGAPDFSWTAALIIDLLSED